MTLHLVLRYLKDNKWLIFITVLLAVTGIILHPVSYFWDESWVYAPAVQLMAINGPSLLPDAIPLDYSRGHPLLFHFILGSSIVLLGNSVIILKSTAALISILAVIIFYKTIGQVFNQSVALIASTLWICQSIFLAQFSMVLPEMLLTLLALLTIYSHTNKANWLYMISGSCLVLTKESGLVLIASILLCDFFHFLLKSDKSLLDFIKTIGISALPILSFSLFLWVQHALHGWYFYPEHIAMQTYDLTQILSKCSNITSWIILGQYRWMLLVSLVAAGIFHFVSHRSILFHSIQLKYLTVYGVFACSYLLFTSMNFYSARYLLVLIPFYALVVAIGIVYLVKSTWIKWCLTVMSVSLLSYYSWVISRSKADDVSLGYMSYMKIQSAAINYLEEHQYYDQPIYSNFLIQEALRQPLAGYRHTIQEFTKLNDWDHRPSIHYQLFSSIELEDHHDQVSQDSAQQLINRWQCPSGWIELYYITQK